MTTRVLFLDDSGKPDAKHASGAVVIAGLAVPSECVPALSRRVLAAKNRYFPARGHPASWEVKSESFIKPKPWKRRKNRDFMAELVKIVGAVGGTFYSAWIKKARIKKARMIHSTSLATTMQLQRPV